MADKTTANTILAIGFEYTNSEDKKKTTYLKLPNPKASLTTEAWIKQLAQPLISGENPILKTDEGAAFDSATAIFTAYTEYTRSVEYDIGIES